MAGFMNTTHLPYRSLRKCAMDMIDVTRSIEISLDKLYACYIPPVVMFHSDLLLSMEHVREVCSHASVFQSVGVC